MLSLDKQNRYRERYRALRPGWRTSGEVFESFVRRYATGDAAVLDLGCGAGGVMELLGAQVRMVVGVDRHLPSLLGNRIRIMQRILGDVNALPFHAASFDLVVCSWVIEHVAYPDRLFGEVSRVLKPGGHFVFLTPNAAHYITMLNRLAPKAAQAPLVRALYGRKREDTFPVVYRANTLPMLRKMATAAGLYICALETVHDPTYLAFGELPFRLSAFVERFVPAERAVHIVGDFAKG
ncbi:MAG: class I SAM-dependent methyltransferase [Thermoflexales bacterium]|nr:class I SAM-dependent methyltransferase [Thermoflexales bacterium]MDW8352507.1 class I SAM-dependent methyltransferase [Anaerolineae bacterium]